MLIIHISLFLFIAIVVPVLIGNEVIGALNQEITISKSYVFGTVTMWAIGQIVSVPLILIKSSFIIVIVLLSLIYVILSGVGIYKRRWINRLLPEITREIDNKYFSYGFLVIMLTIIGVLICVQISLQHTDADDARFVVSAVDIVRTNRMFVTNPSSGENWGSWYGEFARDIFSPWAIYIAYLAKITGISTGVMAHTMMPVSLMLAVYAAYWMLSDEFFHGKVVYRCIFVMAWLLINLYGYASLCTSETFLMTRIWQGKSLVTALGIPLQMLVFLWIYKEDNDNKMQSYMVLLLLISFAMCFTSGMGIILCAIMVGCYGLVYGIIKKKWKLMIAMWCAAIPNASYFLLMQVLV